MYVLKQTLKKKKKKERLKKLNKFLYFQQRSEVRLTKCKKKTVVTSGALNLYLEN